MNKSASMAIAATVVGTLTLTAPSPAESALVCAAGTCSATISIAPQPTELNNTILFPLFDSNIGVLTGASVTFTAGLDILTGSRLTNNGTTTQSFQAGEAIAFKIQNTTGPGGALDTALQLLNLIPSTGLVLYSNVPTGDTVAFGPFSLSTTQPLTVSLTALRAPGGGDASLLVTTETTTTIQGGGGNITAKFITEGLLSADIRYIYAQQEVPEPFTAALLGVGLLGLGAARRLTRKTD